MRNQTRAGLIRAALIATSLALPLAAGAQDRAPEAPAPSTPALPQNDQNQAKSLKSVADFDNIADETERSIAIFQETGKVLLNPRCVNCHPAGDRPLQGMDMHLHQPPVQRGDADFGMPGMMCNTCHGPKNAPVVAQSDNIKSIPGNPNWHLAPIEMAWQGRSLGDICRQIKDQDRNGGKTLAELVEHMASDDLVGWGWHPGKGREPVPGTQKQFGELYKAWAATGAHCPD
ncbi:Isoquinoline 1-oxidoreductase subunit [Jiella endophytica]|uniref:Isoquinoline 1-oxidoreductase subunit n=1 Tax=Jiella endophytica TaxID=2558362 RepID=A0A4Y8RBG7_9HYPH|nr:Isoquinoline 1-oxidoreductase subunit [Jiella endophytica]TFF19078.1 Isoquinoline 1-oxidoreductase subunit [Jiella endophytica]